MKSFVITLFLLGCSFIGHSQEYTPKLQDSSLWTLKNRTVENINENGKSGVKLSEAASAGLYILKDYIFSEGTIEFDIKGRDLLQRSFIGLAFHMQNDSTYDVVYFRPFNFQNADTSRRIRAVQYMSIPNYGWSKLRTQFPSQYEKKVIPVPNPNDWFHVTLNIKGDTINAYVENSTIPSLVVKKLTNTKSGKIALFVDNGSDGSFANLKIKK
jgi:hypothetical protein